MPMLRASTLEQLRLAYRRGDDAVLPMIAGRRGNPALLGRPLFAAVRQALRGDEGARRLLARASSVREELGRASCRERGCQYVLLSVVAVTFKTQQHRQDIRQTWYR